MKVWLQAKPWRWPGAAGGNRYVDWETRYPPAQHEHRVEQQLYRPPNGKTWGELDDDLRVADAERRLMVSDRGPPRETVAEFIARQKLNQAWPQR